MNSNPCLRCFLRNEDKNNDTCKKCSKRVNYVRGLDEALGFSASYAPEVFTLQTVSISNYGSTAM